MTAVSIQHISVTDGGRTDG